MVSLFSDVRSRVSKIDNIRFVVRKEFRNKNSFLVEDVQASNLIIGMENVDTHHLLTTLFVDQKDVLIENTKLVSQKPKAYLYSVILKSYERYTIEYIEVKKGYDFSYLSNDIVILDKDSLIKKHRSGEVKTIGSEEFKNKCLDFFFDLTEVGLLLAKNQLVVANFKYDRCKKGLLDIAKPYINMKYEANVYIGDFGENLEVNLEKEMQHLLTTSFDTGDKDRFWKSIFNIASLYRKMGLELSRKLQIEYPKKEDVDSLNYLRKIYNEIG